MAVRKIIRMGHPALRRPARTVDEADIGSDAMHRLVADMIDTLHDYGGIGLAAPQINEGIRLAIVEIPAGPTRYGELEGRGLTICVNPRIEIVKPETAGYWEGCLSVPGLRGFVERPQHINVHYTNLKRERETISVDGFLATVFQQRVRPSRRQAVRRPHQGPPQARLRGGIRPLRAARRRGSCGQARVGSP